MSSMPRHRFRRARLAPDSVTRPLHAHLKRLYLDRCPVRDGYLYPRGLNDPKGAVPDWAPGLRHTAPTYVSRSRDRVSHGQGGTLLLKQVLARPMVDETIEQTKAALRIKALAARALLDHDERAEAAQAAAQHFFDGVALDPADVVAAYWRIRDELDCQPILVRLMDSNQTVVLPAVTGPEAALDLRVWEQGASLYEAGFGTLAPSELAPRAEPDIVIMPLLGFDSEGTRLGYGSGYYDRTLAGMKKNPRLVGLAFAAQE